MSPRRVLLFCPGIAFSQLSGPSFSLLSSTYRSHHRRFHCTHSPFSILDLYRPSSHVLIRVLFLQGITGGWRWVQAFLGFFSGAITLVGVLGLPETYAPILLRNRAQALSKATGKHYLAKLDVGRDIRVIAQFKVALSRPWVLLIKEPIVLVTALYIAIVYGILYCFFAAFPIVFQQGRGWNAGVGGLA